jgi:hypothetical protein
MRLINVKPVFHDVSHSLKVSKRRRPDAYRPKTELVCKHWSRDNLSLSPFGPARVNEIATILKAMEGLSNYV